MNPPCKALLLAALILLGSRLGHAQQTERRARALYDRAQQELQEQSPLGDAQAEAYLKKAIGLAPDYLDAYAQMATLLSSQHRYSEALPYFDRAQGLDSAALSPAWLLYARAEAGAGHFRQAIRRCQAYLRLPGLRADARAEALQWLGHFNFGAQSAALHLPFRPVNLGDSINSPDAEYFPSLPIDGKTLIFTRNLGGHNEDFYISHLLADSVWSRARNMGSPINTPYNEGAETISQDGRLLIYTICNRPDGMGSCDIYYSDRQPDGSWSSPRNIGPPVNSPYWDSQPCLSPDNRELYFVSNRPGGYGGSDIYVSQLGPDGRWGPARNLGPHINTAGDESSPFIHADNQTLYFASDGWPGLGGVDLYYSRKALRGGGWELPHNLGYPINTIDHDGSIFVCADGKTAYFASDRSDSRGLLDIYRFELYAAARPIRTLYVEGSVYDAHSRQRLQARLELMDLDSTRVLDSLSSAADGSFLVTLPVGKNYGLQVSQPGYLFYSSHFELKENPQGRPYRLEVPLQPIEVAARTELKNVFFAFDRYRLEPQSRAELDKLCRFLNDNPAVKVQIRGYTDSVGSAGANLLLSQRRAQAVVDYLVAHGIAASRLSAKGYGDSQPRASNATEQGRALNRRTECVITAK